MASSKEYLDFILEQVSELDNISYSIFKRESVNKSKKVFDKTLPAEALRHYRVIPQRLAPARSTLSTRSLYETPENSASMG